VVSGPLRVGRDHIAATVNTLFLAYAGAALPLLILFVTGQDSLGTVATTEVVAVEVVRALCGSGDTRRWSCLDGAGASRSPTA
jgi:uncharacterized membrane protein